MAVAAGKRKESVKYLCQIMLADRRISPYKARPPYKAIFIFPTNVEYVLIFARRTGNSELFSGTEYTPRNGQ
jgi:hypothetical protein